MLRRSLAVFVLATLGAVPLVAAAPAPKAPAAAASPAPRNDYADTAFTAPLAQGLRAFYRRDFVAARKGFEDAIAVIPDNTLAIALLNATAAQTPGKLDGLVDAEEEVLAKNPKSPLAHVRLAFSYMFVSLTGRDRRIDAREELNAAVQLDPTSQSAHTALGIMRETERSANRAKTEFLAALEVDPQNVLAREYLALIYQNDLKDPQRALTAIIDVPNLVPDYADIYFHLASLMHDLGQYDAAINYATRGPANRCRSRRRGGAARLHVAGAHLPRRKEARRRAPRAASLDHRRHRHRLREHAAQEDRRRRVREAPPSPSPAPSASAVPKKKT